MLRKKGTIIQLTEDDVMDLQEVEQERMQQQYQQNTDPQLTHFPMQQQQQQQQQHMVSGIHAGPSKSKEERIGLTQQQHHQ